jgi:hypothetical protein
MHMRVVEYSNDWNGALAAFNARLAAGGSAFRLPHPPDLYVTTPMIRTGLLQKLYLAVDEGDDVRGGYVLKFQDYWLGGEAVKIADFRLPVSEAVVNHRYSHLAAGLLVDAQRRQPLLYGLGMGGLDEPVARLFLAAGWQMFSVCFYFQVVHPFPFLRNIVHLRKSLARRLALDFLACSGLGWAAATTLRLCLSRRIPAVEAVEMEVVEQFGPWADEVWEAARPHYGFCSVRDAAALAKIYPRHDLPTYVRLKISSRGRPVGWSLLRSSALSDHAYFGNMKLGTIVDCFAEPQHVAQVLLQSREYLVREGVDLIISNQSHSVWRKAFHQCGFIAGPSNVLFASSRELTEAMQGKRLSLDDIHVNRGDGDGPINL